MLPIKSFTPKPFIEAAEILLNSDETLMALDLLEMLPSYYKDNKIKEIEDLKNEIRSKIATASFYATHAGVELEVSEDNCKAMSETLRGMLLCMDVKAINDDGLVPHIFDHAPGEGFVPIMLKHKGLKFTYEQIYVNHPTRMHTLKNFEEIKWDKIAPAIWLSTEVVEHLHYEDEIRADINQKCWPDLPDVIHVSTPLYTFNPNVTNWKDIGWLGHLRTYSPTMFMAMIQKLFPDYSMAYYESQVQHARLVNPLTKFEAIKKHYQMDLK